MKAKAKQDGICDSYLHSKHKRFKKGSYYSVKVAPSHAEEVKYVYIGGLPMCAVDSPFFNENFEVINSV